MIRFTTNKGVIDIELDHEHAPKSSANFEQYVRDGFYDGTIFHRVIKGFMIQGGGFERGMKEKATRAPIENEAANGLKNNKYTIAMARTSAPALRVVPVLHQRRRQRLPEPHGSEPAGLGLRRLRQGHGRPERRR